MMTNRMRSPRSRDHAHDRLTAITFDLWGTLLHLSPRNAARYEEERERIWLDSARSWPRAEGVEPVKSSEEEARAQVVQETRTEATLGRTRSVEAQGHRLAELLGREYHPGFVSRQLDPLVRHLPVRIEPADRRTLAELERSGLRLGVVSNLLFEPAGSVRALLAEHHLLRFFHHVSLSEELPWCKPSPRIFQDCLEELGVPACHAAHVGDSEEDVTGATREGYGAVGVIGSPRRTLPRIGGPSVSPSRRTARPRCVHLGSVSELTQKLLKV